MFLTFCVFVQLKTTYFWLARTCSLLWGFVSITSVRTLVSALHMCTKKKQLKSQIETCVFGLYLLQMERLQFLCCQTHAGLFSLWFPCSQNIIGRWRNCYFHLRLTAELPRKLLRTDGNKDLPSHFSNWATCESHFCWPLSQTCLFVAIPCALYLYSVLECCVLLLDKSRSGQHSLGLMFHDHRKQAKVWDISLTYLRLTSLQPLVFQLDFEPEHHIGQLLRPLDPACRGVGY